MVSTMAGSFHPCPKPKARHIVGPHNYMLNLNNCIFFYCNFKEMDTHYNILLFLVLLRNRIKLWRDSMIEDLKASHSKEEIGASEV